MVWTDFLQYSYLLYILSLCEYNTAYHVHSCVCVCRLEREGGGGGQGSMSSEEVLRFTLTTLSLATLVCVSLCTSILYRTRHTLNVFGGGENSNCCHNDEDRANTHSHTLYYTLTCSICVCCACIAYIDNIISIFRCTSARNRPQYVYICILQDQNVMKKVGLKG